MKYIVHAFGSREKKWYNWGPFELPEATQVFNDNKKFVGTTYTSLYIEDGQGKTVQSAGWPKFLVDLLNPPRGGQTSGDMVTMTD